MRPPNVSTTFTNLTIRKVSTAVLGKGRDSPPDILDPPLCAPSLLFLLLASLNLGGLASDLIESEMRVKDDTSQIYDLSSTSERSVDLSSLEGDGQVDGLVLEEGKADLVLKSKFQCFLSLITDQM